MLDSHQSDTNVYKQPKRSRSISHEVTEEVKEIQTEYLSALKL